MWVSSARYVFKFEMGIAESKHFRVHCCSSKQRPRWPNSCALLGGARVSRLPEPGTAVSHTLVRLAHLERHGRADLRSAIARGSAGGSVGGAKVTICSLSCGN